MKDYYRIDLKKKVASPNDPRGRDFAVCRAETRADALRQLPLAMQDCVSRVTRHLSMRECYPDPHGILRESAL